MRARTGSAGQKPELEREYIFYVRTADYDKAREAVQGIEKQGDWNNANPVRISKRSSKMENIIKVGIGVMVLKDNRRHARQCKG